MSRRLSLLQVASSPASTSPVTALALLRRRGRATARTASRIADTHGIDFVYHICSYLPLIGLLTVFLPRIPKQKSA
ncbi:hypothetical protein GGQ65_001002 [Rhizobium fabae]|uniref:Uncharacterized protein n=1 Tax=Rhizobium fabae TaxID=573179 RepID=A0A7W6B1B5_9HYPH|nr:hypothetical protein [Rhizobium fabae]